MKLEALTVCVDYADFLQATLPYNRPYLDRMVVVTKPDDLETQEVCAKYDTQCVTTHAFGPNGTFCKGAGINRALAELDADGWVLHLDADMLLPIHFRQLIEKRNLDPKNIYGADRINAVGEDQYKAHLNERLKQGPPRTFGTEGWWTNTIRVVFYEYGGWLPCGFFQMWNPQGSGIHRYPEDRLVAEPAHAGNTDLQFAGQWETDRRILMPEIHLCHVESEQIGEGANWFGRKTQKFGQPTATEEHRHHRPDRDKPPFPLARPKIIVPVQYESHRPRVGEILTLDPGEWAGDRPIEFEYRWVRGAGVDYDIIRGADDLTYEVTEEDVRHRLAANVFALNDAGFRDEWTLPTEFVVK